MGLRGRPGVAMLGRTFGRLTVIEAAGSAPHGRGTMWRCSCACGGERTARRDNLLSGVTQSCGCLRRAMRPITKPAIEEHW